jgi:hypothetical protein
MKRITLLAVLLTGCEAFFPNGDAKRVPTPAPAPAGTQRVEIVLRVEGEGKVSLAGDSTINLKAQAPARDGVCECGCGKAGCDCNNPLSAGKGDGAPSSATRQDAVPPRESLNLKTSRDLFVLSVDGCGACDLAVADLKRLGFDVTKVAEQSPNGVYPAIRNRRGTVYAVDDGYWNSGVDDVAAAKKLGE